MHLAYLAYASRSTDTERLTIGKILSAAHKFNGPHHITGLLLFDGTFYLQRLEGDREAISDLYRRIAADPRHTEVNVLAAGSLVERQCPGWSMGFVDDRDTVKNAIMRFSTSRRFDPYGMSAESVLALTRFVVEHHSEIRTTVPA